MLKSYESRTDLSVTGNLEEEEGEGSSHNQELNVRQWKATNWAEDRMSINEVEVV